MRPRVHAALLACFALVLSGCLGPAQPGPQPVNHTVLPPAPPAPVIAHNATGEVVNLTQPLANATGNASLATEALASYAFASVAPGELGGEPNIGLTKSGAAFVTVGNDVFRSVDGGATWKRAFHWGSPEPVGSTLQQSSPIGDAVQTEDPNLWVDPATSRVFVSELGPTPFPADCAGGAWSDDDGASWTISPVMCGLPLEDHQKVATGPYAKGGPLQATPAYPNAVYFCYNKIVSTNCAVSLDGGLTWPLDQPAAIEARDGCAGINGHEAIAPDGTVYVPIGHRSFTYSADTQKPLVCDAPYVAVSADNGVSWQVRKGPTAKGGPFAVDPDMTVTPDGTAYLLFGAPDQLQWLYRSHDGWKTWQGPFAVTAPGVRSTVLGAITSGDDGRVAIAYLGTRDTANESSKAPNETRWNLYVATSFNAASADPVFVTQQLTNDSDPVQIGCIWMYGGQSDCRNLLDFIDLSTAPDGRYYVVYTDGCTKGCAGNPAALAKDSHSSDVTVAYLLQGPSLLAAKGVLGPPGAAAPGHAGSAGDRIVRAANLP
jgi:hypothetical protein